MKEFVLKGRLTLERVAFRVSAKTLEGALARAANGDFDGYDTDALTSARPASGSTQPPAFQSRDNRRRRWNRAAISTARQN
jgi:hypothetical protein